MKFYLSFVDTELDQFLGACVVEAADFLSAVQESHAQGCNPGGQVMGVEIPDDMPADSVENSWPMNVLLTREFLSGSGAKSIREWENDPVPPGQQIPLTQPG